VAERIRSTTPDPATAAAPPLLGPAGYGPLAGIGIHVGKLELLVLDDLLEPALQEEVGGEEREG